MKALRRAAAALAVTCVAHGTAPAAGDEVTIEQPRAFGHVIGDLLTQRVLLERGGHGVQPRSLPGAGRVGSWLERRGARIERDGAGRRWLVVEYQLVNAPQALATVQLPRWELPLTGGGAALQVPEWPLSVAPLTPRSAFSAGALTALRPDLPPPRIDTQPIERRVAVLGAVLALVLCAWLVWWLWRNRGDAAQLPFARALRELHALSNGAEAGPPAWQALHRAFDRTAGLVVQASTLPRLFERAPHLLPLRGAIEAFYAQSAAHFYGCGEAAPEHVPLSLRVLCGQLCRAERRHAR